MSRRRSSVRIARRIRWALYGIGIGVWLSGGLWLFAHYFLVKQGEFGPQTAPLEPWSLKAHGAFAFAAIWIFGLLWGLHIMVAWPTRRRRLSGAFLTGAFLLLILSGYLLYYVGGDETRSVVSIIHWTLGLAGPIFYVLHRVRFRVRRRSEPRSMDGPPGLALPSRSGRLD